MDLNWAHSAWKPTIVFDEENIIVKGYMDAHTDYLKPRKAERKILISSIWSTTKALACSPYSPTLWLHRGRFLLKMGYPELATGDAYKATLLFNLLREGDSRIAPLVIDELAHDADVKWLLDSRTASSNVLKFYRAEALQESQDQERSALILLTQSLLCTHSFAEAHETLSKISKQSEEDPQLTTLQSTVELAWAEQTLQQKEEGFTMSEIWREERFGQVQAQRYPWMNSKITTRSRQTIQQANCTINRTSGASCRIARSNIRNGEEDVLGLFATARLRAGEHFLQDNTTWCAVDDPKKSCQNCCKTLPRGAMTVCCGVQLCSGICWEQMQSYHQCAKNLTPYDTARPSPLQTPEKVTDDRLLLRVLTSLVSDGKTHPLQGPTMNALTASYDREDPIAFSLEADIVRPIDMLTKLGIDIFANQEYDTWVIMTVLTRIRNNVRENNDHGHHLAAINPLFSFFNHSCDPNVTDVEDENDSSSTLVMKATRSVKAGEELFISYLHENQLKLSRAERNETLRQWIGRDCCCTRCSEEMATEPPSSEYSGETMVG